MLAFVWAATLAMHLKVHVTTYFIAHAFWRVLW